MELSEPPRLMLVFDPDNTMVDHKDKHHSALLRFGALWQADYNHDSVLVYSTGRSPALYAKLRVEAACSRKSSQESEAYWNAQPGKSIHPLPAIPETRVMHSWATGWNTDKAYLGPATE